MIEAFLVSIIVVLLVDRYLYARDMNSQVGDAMKAILSRNVQEYVEAKAADKTKKTEDKPVDEIPIAEATDEQFLKAIKETNI